MGESKYHFGTFIWRIAAAHTVAYFVAGIFAVAVLRYDELFGTGPLDFMHSVDSMWVAAGPGLQLIRGVLLACFLYPFRTIFFETDYGWVKFWTLLFGLGYLLTISAAPGSFEGLIYTNIPVRYQLLGIPELILYLSLFTAAVFGWYRTDRKLFTVISVIAVLFIVLMSLLGVLAAAGIIETS